MYLLTLVDIDLSAILPCLDQIKWLHLLSLLSLLLHILSHLENKALNVFNAVLKHLVLSLL